MVLPGALPRIASTPVLIAFAARADGPDISAQRLLESWKDEDPSMRMVVEMIASAFASGFSWGGDAAGKRAYCASPNLKGGQIMSAFEEFLRDNPMMADQPYGAAMAGTLSKAFPCTAQSQSRQTGLRGPAPW
jgi:Ssp1 endopeptidase immunity protein Rap1a